MKVSDPTDSDADQKLRQHVSDRMIAQQLEPPTDAEWLAKCRKVAIAQAKLRGTLTEQCPPN